MREKIAAKGRTPLWVKGALVLLLIGLLALFLFPSLAKGWMAQRLSQISGLSTHIGSLRLSLAAPRFSLKDLTFENPAAFSRSAFAQIENVKVQYHPATLLTGRLDLKKVEIIFQEFRLIRNEKGMLNLPAFSKAEPGAGDLIEEVVLHLSGVTFTDLSGAQPIQKSFDLALTDEVYRNVKGISGILEIVSWEVLKRTGVEARPTAGSQAAGQSSPAPAAPAPPEPNPSGSAPSPAPSAQAAGELS